MSARDDRGHSGADRAFADLELTLPTDEGGIANLDSGNVGDGVKFSGCSIERNSKGAGAQRCLRWWGRLGFAGECNQRQ
jgi:hypothetical protein